MKVTAFELPDVKTAKALTDDARLLFVTWSYQQEVLLW